MFTDNKYTKYYMQITDRARNRHLKSYTERHHIVPQSLGGSDDKENLVNLTAREHFICHWLLVKMTQGENRSKMVYALRGMNANNEYQERYSSYITSRVYERYRIEHSKIHSETMKGKIPVNKGRKMSEEQKELLRQRAKANHVAGIYGEEAQKKRIAKVVGQKRSEETKLKMSLSHKGKLKGPMSEEEKLKRSVKQKGVSKKQGHSDNVRAAVLGNVSINKNGIEKKVKKDTIDQWLSQGWQLGGKPRIKSKQS